MFPCPDSRLESLCEGSQVFLGGARVLVFLKEDSGKRAEGVIRAASGVTHGPDMKDKLPCVCSEGRTPLSRQKHQRRDL